MGDRPKVLYIAAWSRSGTTIVDNILNGYPGVFSTGELRYLWQRGLIEGRNCGCRTPLPECALWAEVVRHAYQDLQLRPREVVTAQRLAVRVRHTLPLLHRPWNAHALRYADHLSRIYQAIARATGAGLIVDSTKFPAEAAIIAGLTDVDAYLLHIVRDPRGVAYSWSRPTMTGRSATASTTNWLGWNALIERVGGRYGDRYLRIRYEDFAAEPKASIESILGFTGTPAVAGPFLGPRTVRLGPNHTVAGNPRRFLVGDIDIHPDDAWLRELPGNVRRGVTAAALPLLLRYAYPLVPRQRGLQELPKRRPAHRPASRRG